jgi:hypothetical protein
MQYAGCIRCKKHCCLLTCATWWRVGASWGACHFLAGDVQVSRAVLRSDQGVGCMRTRDTAVLCTTDSLELESSHV